MTQWLSFFALALALVLNVDSVTIAKAVWEQPTLVENLKPRRLARPAALRIERTPPGIR